MSWRLLWVINFILLKVELYSIHFIWISGAHCIFLKFIRSSGTWIIFIDDVRVSESVNLSILLLEVSIIWPLSPIMLLLFFLSSPNLNYIKKGCFNKRPHNKVCNRLGLGTMMCCQLIPFERKVQWCEKQKLDVSLGILRG
jgi:hypothetical protein